MSLLRLDNNIFSDITAIWTAVIPSHQHQYMYSHLCDGSSVSLVQSRETYFDKVVCLCSSYGEVMIPHGFIVAVDDNDRLNLIIHLVARRLSTYNVSPHLRRSLLSVVLTTCSLMNSIAHERAKPTKGSAYVVSTVGIELRRHQMGDTKVEFYDCAGQLDYAGMQQVFLSRRALYLLVWDVAKCHGKQGDELDKVSNSRKTCIQHATTSTTMFD